MPCMSELPGRFTITSRNRKEIVARSLATIHWFQAHQLLVFRRQHLTKLQPSLRALIYWLPARLTKGLHLEHLHEQISCIKDKPQMLIYCKASCLHHPDHRHHQIHWIRLAILCWRGRPTCLLLVHRLSVSLF